MTEEIVIERAEFNTNVCLYWLFSGTVIMTVTVVGIPLLLIWLPLGLILTRRYLARMDCVLTDRVLKVNKGILVRTEKTIPLDKITDMGMVQGPIMRLFNIEQLTVETAGQSGGAGGMGSLVSLTGIKDARSFRKKVLEQRDRIHDMKPVTDQISIGESGNTKLLTEIRDSLNRIEKTLSRVKSEE